ncbi:TIR domain-containing protein [Ruegeria sp.]|uniref:TIR domain-containing protein n=1 Tax=Ruegeria sp. TaxID=1879320 RepID=UPI002321FDF4|nr:TIR domain-containing protein [Ruegeria sp.]MDA7967213.1 TIR domain-containing protein [Ruegeria sp.]
MAKTQNIFISHIHEDDAGLKKVKDLCRKHGLTVRDGSINKEKPNKAKNADYILNKIIGPRIKWCSTMVVYITPQTKNSEWVNKEILRAERLGKRIVGVWAHGHAGCEPPAALKHMSDAMVGWDGGRIVDAVTGNFEGKENTDGSIASPATYKRVACQ